MAKSKKPESKQKPEKPEKPEKPDEKKVDEDWKEEVREEREVAHETQGQEQPPQRGPLPMPNFSFLVTSLAMQVLMSFGEIPSPVTGKPNLDLEQAKHGIDTLGVLEEKTRGNLTEEEDNLLQTTLYDLRVRYVSLSSSGASPRPS